jgi:hypothetical protein
MSLNRILIRIRLLCGTRVFKKLPDNEGARCCLHPKADATLIDLELIYVVQYVRFQSCCTDAVYVSVNSPCC